MENRAKAPVRDHPASLASGLLRSVGAGGAINGSARSHSAWLQRYVPAAGADRAAENEERAGGNQHEADHLVPGDALVQIDHGRR